jgi:death-on-curing family protein
MDDKILYISADEAVDIHDNMVIANSGGKLGVHNRGQLESSLEHIQNDIYYPTFEIKLARIIYAISQFHTFIDGNKRTSIALGVLFLKKNDYDYCTDTFIEEMENIVLLVVQKYIEEPLLVEIVKSIIDYNCLTDEVKIKIINTKLEK